MSRLGDLIHTERLRRSMTAKQVAKKCGVSEGYIMDVEAGTRIIQDEQARRILRKIGMTEHTETGFTLDDIAATVDLETVKPSVSPKPAAPREDKPVYSTEEKDATVTGSVWLDALTSVLKRVPVYNAVIKEQSHRLLPILDGHIEGASPDKVFYFIAPDDSMRGFRVLKDDLALIVPAPSPVDGAIMLVEQGEKRCLRKIKKLDAINVLLQSYDREYIAEHAALSDITLLGRAARLEIDL